MYLLCLKQDPLRYIRWTKRMGYISSRAVAVYWVEQVKFWGFNTDITYFSSAYRSSQILREAWAITGRQVKPTNQAEGFSFYLSLTMLWFVIIYFFLLQLELQLVMSTTMITHPWGGGQMLSLGSGTETSPLKSWGEKQFHKFKISRRYKCDNIFSM